MKNLMVKKPWGEEYIICKTNNAATWHLKINSRKKTSLHCHPKKKTGFILLDGKVEVMIGFYEKKILKAPDKLMIRPGLFHSTKSLSKKNSIVLEIETPINKNDFVNLDFGEILIFNPTLLHGNLINKTNHTRVSLNIRFKSLKILEDKIKR